MNVRLPKEWDELKPSAQEMIKRFYAEAANKLINEQVDKEEAEMQKTWILYGAVALAENGSTADEIMV